MNAVPGTRHDRRRARTRAAILDAAERLFVSEGYGGARIEAIAEAADVAVGSIYAHFGSKDGLWSALAERALEHFDRYMEQAYQGEWSPLEQVIAGGDAYLRFHAEHPGSFRFLAFDGEQARLPVGDPELAARVIERMAGTLARFQAKIAEAMAAGEAIDGDARLHARFLWAAWNATVALSVRGDELALTDAEVEACLQQARGLVLEGLSAPAFRGPDGRSRGRLVRVSSPPED
ncbi:MAG TPA: TetR/AcrR family transcriptional regulator [Baekduia sp.]|nr:TetR/AcrR family transcriptional regulator [Baekduia sp.]